MITGDPLTSAAGDMKDPLTHFVLLVTVAKVTRCPAVATITVN
ncbi:hypothetical protein BHMPCIPO_04393 [Ensifer sesbaniae]|jgi:membrane protein YqaA with SNARE-associated domain|nr:hypothetical protein [Ensifer sesbaniae]